MSLVGSSTRAHQLDLPSVQTLLSSIYKDRVRAVSYQHSPSRQRGSVVRPTLECVVGALVGVIAPQTLRTCTLPQAQAPTEVLLLILTLCWKQGGVLSVLDWILLQNLRPGRRTANPIGSRPVLLLVLAVLRTLRPGRRTANPIGGRPVPLLVLSSAFHLLHATRKDGMLADLDWLLLKVIC